MLPQRKFVKGLDASEPIYNQPPGTFPRGSNLVLTKRGGLRIVDGATGLLLQNNTIKNVPGMAFGDILLMQIFGITPQYIGSIYDPSIPEWRIVFLPTIYDLVTNSVITLPSWPQGSKIKFLQFNNQIIIFGDNTQQAMFWNGLTPPGTPVWSANTIETVGNFINDGTNAQQVIAVTGDAKTGGGAPTWNTALGGLTTDNHVTWINRGHFAPNVLTNSFVPVYPQWTPNTAFSSQAIIQVGFDGTGGLGGIWQPNQVRAVNQEIIDYNNHIQKVTAVAGTAVTGAAEPIWNTGGGNTVDGTAPNTVTWTDQGLATFFNFTALQGGTTGAGPQPPQFTNVLNSTVQDNNIIWQNTGATAGSSIAPRAVKYAIVYAGSLWVGNTSPYTTADKVDGPTVLRMSDLNNPLSWNPLNVAFIGKDDGTQITGLATFTIAEAGITPTGSLVVFKDYTTFQIIGIFGSPNFAIVQAQTDMGCIAGDTIQFLPGFGIARLTHLGPAVFDGVRDRLFGEQVRPYIFGGEDDIVQADPGHIQNCIGAQVSNPPMYILGIPLVGANGGVTRLLCYDLVLKAWAAPIDLPWPISAIRQIRQQGNGLVVNTVSGGFQDGAVRQMFSPGSQWFNTPGVGQTTPIAWSIQSPELFSKSAAEGVYVREVYVRGKYATTLNIKVDLDTGTVVNQVGKLVVLPSGEFEASLPIHGDGKSAHVTISGSGQVEIHTIDWDTDSQPAAPAAII